MLYKLWMSVVKEYLLLKKDLGGLVILFLMPLVLIITVTLIQDSSFKKVSPTKIPILLVDKDNGNVSKTVLQHLDSSGAFTVVNEIAGVPLTEETARESVFAGKYQLAVIIPENLSSGLQNKIDQNVNNILKSFGLVDSTQDQPKNNVTGQKEIKLYFDPAVQLSFKEAVMSSVDKMVSQIETQSIYATFKGKLGGSGAGFEQQSFITFKEILPSNSKNDLGAKPNSVQHNVSAWALFAMFFIVIPLSINIVKEKSQGTFVRLRTNPVPNYVVFAGKTLTYLVVCMLQFYMMIAVAIYLFPHLGLPALNLGGNLRMMSVVAFFSGLAAIGYGILLGTLAKTQEQSAPFGATSVIILAAIGGVWVPVFAMPKVMQVIAKSSPMNWGLDAFYDVLLRNAPLTAILPKIGLLFLFFMVTFTLSMMYEKKKRAV